MLICLAFTASHTLHSQLVPSSSQSIFPGTKCKECGAVTLASRHGCGVHHGICTTFILCDSKVSNCEVSKLNPLHIQSYMAVFVIHWKCSVLQTVTTNHANTCPAFSTQKWRCRYWYPMGLTFSVRAASKNSGTSSDN